ncbi:MAG: helix-turn-helix domain-containing protein [Wenzhouxiangella sp.]|jgi:AraC-like DNA-binding protein|nr:helix-turn-helix domain-containing protein [Wenzhouxiangella sp.]
MTGHFQPSRGGDGFLNGLSGHYLTHFLSALPEDVHDIVRALGLLPDELSGERRVPLISVLRLLEAIEQRAEPGWHVQPALEMEAAHHGPLGIAVISAPTIGRGLDVLLRFHAVRMPFVDLHRDSFDGAWRARLDGIPNPEGTWATLMEIHLLALAGLVRRMLGPRAKALLVSLPLEPIARRPSLELALHEKIDLSGREYVLSLPMSALTLPCTLADNRMHEDAMATLRTLEVSSHQGSGLEREIRQRILARLSDPPSQATMAQALGMSERTLHRRLKACGISYREVSADIKASVAFHRLRHTTEPISRIASDLGYQDAANFGRACRRWFGCAPGNVRHRDPHQT